MSTSVFSWVLAVAWGVLVALPVARRARAVPISARVVGLGVSPRSGKRRRRTSRVLWHPRVRRRVGQFGIVGRVLGGLARRRRERAVDAALRAELPVAVDLVGVAVGAGCTPFQAVQVASEWSPDHVAGVLAGVGRQWELGASFSDAIDDMATRQPSMRSFADAMVASDRLGSPVGPALGRISAEARADTRRRAEQRARALPVRLLFPLVFLVLPAFGLLTVAPALLAGLART